MFFFFKFTVEEQLIGNEFVKLQARYVASKNLLGAMAWSVDTDDFRGNCHGKPFPLTTAIVETLNGPIVYPSTTRPAASTTSPGGQTTTTARVMIGQSESNERFYEKLLLGDYKTDWYSCHYH